MITKLKKTGNSRSITFSPAILSLLKIKEDTQLEVTTDGQSITLTPVKSEDEAVFDAAKSVLGRHHEAFKALADR